MSNSQFQHVDILMRRNRAIRLDETRKMQKKNTELLDFRSVNESRKEEPGDQKET